MQPVIVEHPAYAAYQFESLVALAAAPAAVVVPAAAADQSLPYPPEDRTALLWGQASDVASSDRPADPY